MASTLTTSLQGYSARLQYPSRAAVPVAALPAPSARLLISRPGSNDRLSGSNCQAQMSARRQPQTCRMVPQASQNGLQTVTVTGAGGRTGSLIFQKLLAAQEQFEARGVVRTDKSAQKVMRNGAPDDAVFVADVALGSSGSLDAALKGADALIIATSAVPQIKKLSLLKVLWKKLLRQEGARPEFYYKGGQYPEQVDWLGQKAQIDAAKAAGVKRVVLISSMGGTDRQNPLNAFGNGKILVFKRRAEEYLIASGLEYCIIHPGGLTDEKGGEREVLLGVDDDFIKAARWRRIPRSDVAELAVQALTLASATNRSVDAVAKEPGEGAPTPDFDALFKALQADCSYGPDSVSG